MSSVNFELYKFFYFSALELNFSKAAQTLHVTQSAVSQAIKSLETQLGVSLFFRQGRSIRLTFEGDVLFRHIEKAYHFIKAAENAIDSIKSLDEGTIFIGASDTITRYYLISKIKAFHSLYPKVRIAINNRPSPRSAELLRNGEIELAVVNLNPEANYEGLLVHPISEMANVFICSSRRKDLLAQRFHLKELSKESLICLEEKSTTRRLLNAFYKEHQVTIRPAFEFGSLDVILESVKSDMGIGFVALNVAQKAIEEGSVYIIPLIEEIPNAYICLLTNANKPLSLATQKFFNLIQQDDHRKEKKI